MNNYFDLSTEQQLLALTQAVPIIGLPAQAIEKDLLVTAVLQLIAGLPFADRLVFKGGTSLSKVWGVIDRFSEDIDLAVDRTFLDAPEGDLTKRQLKKLRKASSVFVRDELCAALQVALDESGMSCFCELVPEPDGEGDGTYPEPRKLMVNYHSLLPRLDYLKPVVQLEVGARSLVEPSLKVAFKSMLELKLPSVGVCFNHALLATAVPAKTFLEKVFLLHELFSIEGHGMKADRKSRHLYDLHRMMDCDFALQAVKDDTLWEIIRHHREVFTSVLGMDYSADIRNCLVLVPREDILPVWKRDYETMAESMIYGEKPSWSQLLDRMRELQRRFRER